VAIYQIENLQHNDFQEVLDGLIITKSSYHPRYNLNWHYHDNPSLTLNLRGGTIDQRKTEVNTIKAGDLVLHRPEEWHKNSFFSKDSRHFCIEFEPHWFKKFDIPNRFDSKSFCITDPNARVKMVAIINEFVNYYQTKQLTTESLLLYCIANLNGQKISKHLPDWIGHLKDLLHDEYDKDLSLTYLSKRINVHPVTISKYFTRHFKTTLGDYVRKIRIGKSLAYLSNKSIAINTIGIQSGFVDNAHYTRNFKKYTGLTPSAYRQFLFHGSDEYPKNVKR